MDPTEEEMGRSVVTADKDTAGPTTQPVNSFRCWISGAMVGLKTSKMHELARLGKSLSGFG